MTRKRPLGALEEEVMEYLWAVGAPSTPSEVHAAIAPELAYTTVMTVLTRLWEKGRLIRERRGRAYGYEPVSSEAEYRAGSMATSLSEAGNRAAVLSSFVEALDDDDLVELRQLLERDG